MILSTFNPKAGFQRRHCEVCGRLRECCQHHIYGVENNRDCVMWVCSNGGKVFYNDPCHAKIHNPVSFGLPASWAYDHGYLRKMDGIIRKKYSPPKKWKLKKQYATF